MERVSGSANNLPKAESRGVGKGKRKKKIMRLPTPILKDCLNHGKSWVLASSEGCAEPLKSKNLLKLTPKKRCPFHHRSLEYERRKSRDTWNNRQVWVWSTKWSRENTNRVLPRECTGHSKQLFPTRQEMTLHMDITRWSILNLDWLYSLQQKMEKLYTISINKIRSWL